MSSVLPHTPRQQLTRCLSSIADAATAQFSHTSALIRGVTAAGAAGALLAGVLLVQGPAIHRPDTVLMTTSTGTLEVGEPTVTLVHHGKEMIGMPPSAAHDTGGEVLVPVTLTNTSSRPVAYSPDQFHLLAGGHQVTAAGEPSNEELRPDAGITLRLTFPATSLADGVRLQYQPAVGPALVATLTSPADPPTPASHEHESH